MKLERVVSDMIESVDYDAQRQILEVVFNTGDTYQYLEVPPNEYGGVDEC